MYAFLLQNWNALRFSPPVQAGDPLSEPLRSVNPKRRRRMVQRLLAARGPGTKSQQALKLQQEEQAQARKAKSRLQKEEDRERRFALRRQKRKEKHRGR